MIWGARPADDSLCSHDTYGAENQKSTYQKQQRRVHAHTCSEAEVSWKAGLCGTNTNCAVAGEGLVVVLAVVLVLVLSTLKSAAVLVVFLAPGTPSCGLPVYVPWCSPTMSAAAVPVVSSRGQNATSPAPPLSWSRPHRTTQAAEHGQRVDRKKPCARTIVCSSSNSYSTNKHFHDSPTALARAAKSKMSKGTLAMAAVRWYGPAAAATAKNLCFKWFPDCHRPSR